MEEQPSPTSDALKEALELSAEILRNIELSELGLSAVALKACRLARLLNDGDAHAVFLRESGGYSGGAGGLSPAEWRLAELAGRVYEEKSGKDGEVMTYAYTESIGQLENQIESSRIGIEAARDPNVSLSSANPSQYLHAPSRNADERKRLRFAATQASKRLAARRTYIYDYALRRHHELKFSAVASDVFSRIRDYTDSCIGEVVPDAVRKFAAVHDNLRSDNPEDWSNAVHSCRRILQDLADSLFPPQSEPREVMTGGKTKVVQLGSDAYINRLVCFAEDQSDSDRFVDLVGAHIRFLGERLDAVFKAAQKGSHSTIVQKEEADRYVVYTYMVVSDLLSLYRAKAD